MEQGMMLVIWGRFDFLMPGGGGIPTPLCLSRITHFVSTKERLCLFSFFLFLFCLCVFLNLKNLKTLNNLSCFLTISILLKQTSCILKNRSEKEEIHHSEVYFQFFLHNLSLSYFFLDFKILGRTRNLFSFLFPFVFNNKAKQVILMTTNIFSTEAFLRDHLSTIIRIDRYIIIWL